MKKFHQMREEFHPHETLVARLSSLLTSLGYCVIKLCIETNLNNSVKSPILLMWHPI